MHGASGRPSCAAVWPDDATAEAVPGCLARPDHPRDPDARDLRDRALIGIMVFSFARIGAVLGMKVEDVYTQNRRLWVRLREKGGKAHAMPCHHALAEALRAYIDAAASPRTSGERRRESAPLLLAFSHRTIRSTWSSVTWSLRRS